MKTELERYKEAVELARNELFALATLGGITSIGNVQAKEALAKINAVLDPPVEMEDIPVEVWAGVDTTTKTVTAIGTKESVSLAVNHSPTNLIKIVKLTGTLTRPKPVKVEKSVSIEAYVTPDGEVKRATKDGYVNYPTFKNCEESYHKTGVLTFTWTE